MPPPATPSVKGVWLGTLGRGAGALRLQARLDPDDAAQSCALDSIDQDSFDIPCRVVPRNGAEITIEVAAVKGGWKGTLSSDGNTLTGTWSQGGPSRPLVLTRQTKAFEPAKVELQPAMPPVDIEGLRAVLDADLASALEKGDLAPATSAGVTVGVVHHGVRRVFTYGASKPDAVFEIGSITKTFTGLILAQLVQQKKVRLDEPVRALLPAGTVEKPATGDEITLLDLSDQHSGLPRMPDNFKPANPENPYVDYDAKALFAFLGSHGVGRPKEAPFGYSNVGVGLLGAALVQKMGISYEALLEQQVTGPLGMRETAIALAPALRGRLAAGHDRKHAIVREWDFDALAGAGAIRSTAGDMLTYLEAQLHPEAVASKGKATAPAKTLAAAIKESHVRRASADDDMEIALGWLHVVASGSYWHNGATAGHTAFAAFDPARDFAVIVLCNSSGGFADKLGSHVAQRLAGRPAISLAPPDR